MEENERNYILATQFTSRVFLLLGKFYRPNSTRIEFLKAYVDVAALRKFLRTRGIKIPLVDM